MALKAEVEAEIKKLAGSNPDELKRLTELYEKYPTLQAAFLADADYQRNIQVAKAQQKAADDALVRAKAQEDKNVKWWTDTQSTVTTLETENAAFKAKITELEGMRDSAAGAGATDAQLKKYDAALAKLQKDFDDNIQTLSSFKGQDGKPRKLVDEEQLNKSADGFGQFLMDSVDILRQHDRKFADMPLTSRELYKFMTENKHENVQKAYDAMTQQKRQETWEAQRTEEIRKELATKMNLPIDSGSTAPPPDGPLRLFINKKQAQPDIPADGSGRLASIAAQEMRAEGKS